MAKILVMTDREWVWKIHDSNRWKKIYEEAIKKDPHRELEETRLAEARFRGCKDGIHTTIKIMDNHLKWEESNG